MVCVNVGVEEVLLIIVGASIRVHHAPLGGEASRTAELLEAYRWYADLDKVAELLEYAEDGVGTRLLLRHHDLVVVDNIERKSPRKEHAKKF